MIVLTRSLLMVIFAGIVSFPLLAQGTTAELNGVVTHDGGPLPGVTITIASPAMQGTRSTLSAVNGAWLLSAIPPGDYTVTFAMEGMTTVTKRARVGLAMSEHVGVAMSPAPVTEAVVVTAAAPSVLETSEIQSNLTAELVEDLPLGRTIDDAIRFAPGVTTAGFISGAFGYDNLQLIDGAVPVSVSGGNWNLFIEDAIQETTVMTGSISAEYGRFTGGVVSAITRSGGNEFSGSFRDSFSNAAWDSTTPAGEENQPSELEETYEATLGGRIVRDRLWFFGAGRYSEKEVPGFYVNSTEPMPAQVETHERWEAKLTGQLTPKQSLVASYLDYHEEAEPNIPGRSWEPSVIDVDGAQLPQSMSSARYNGILTTNALLEAGWSTRELEYVDLGGENRDRVYGTWAVDLNFGGLWGAPYYCGICDKESEENEYFLLKGSYYVATVDAGTHNVVAGYEHFTESRLAASYYSASDYGVFTYAMPELDPDGTFRPVIDAGDLIIYFPIVEKSQGSEFLTQSIFVNDKWDLGAHWSFNVGVRYDANDGSDGSGNKISDDRNVSPRLGAIYDVKGDGRFRLNASYSKYVSKIQEVFASSGGGGVPMYMYYAYDGPKIGGEGSGLGSFDVLERLFEWFDSVGGLGSTDYLVWAFVPGANIEFDGTLESPNAEEWTVGVGTQLGSKGLVRLDLVDRQWKDFYSVETNPGDQVEHPVLPGEYLDVLVHTNTNDIERSYKAVLVQAAYRFTDRINAGGHYTWSESKGNAFGYWNFPGWYPEYKAFPQNNPVGPLFQDQTHKARLWVSWDRPLGAFGSLNVSLLERLESGLPYEANASVRVDLFVTNPGYATPPQSETYFFSGRGAYRWETLTATDLGINWELPLGKARAFVQGEIVNLFDESAQVGGDTGITVLADRDPATPGNQRFDPFTMQPVECVDGGPAVCDWRKSPGFGKATGPDSYQQPLTYRVSAGVRF